MKAVRHILLVAMATCLVATVPSCKREERPFRVQPPAADTSDKVVMSGLRAGSMPASSTQPAATKPAGGPAASPPYGIGPSDTPPATQHVRNGYEENAYATTEGQRLFNAFNCSGCHFHGGGGIGPPLMDDKWIYGSAPEQIFSTIVEGRPNGMPSFRGKIVDYQVWQIVAYVRSMSGMLSKDVASGRSDDMSTAPPPNSMPTPTPVNGGIIPPSATFPG